jgi:hypothetical protein
MVRTVSLVLIGLKHAELIPFITHVCDRQLVCSVWCTDSSASAIYHQTARHPSLASHPFSTVYYSHRVCDAYVWSLIKDRNDSVSNVVFLA